MQPEQKPETAQATEVPVTTAPPLPQENTANQILKPNKFRSKILLAVVGVVCIGLGFAVGAYYCGRDHDEIAHTHTAAVITLPKEATATAECIAGRGKQYILPKDIPMGPIYDIHEGKIVAIEYLVGQKELSETSDMFTSLKLPDGSYDHLAIMPMTAHAGLDEMHFHAIAYLISPAESKKITCAAGDSTMDMTTESHAH